MKRRLFRRSSKPALVRPGQVFTINHNGRKQLAVAVNIEWPRHIETVGLGEWLARNMIVRMQPKAKGDYYSARQVLEMEGWADPETVARVRDQFEEEFCAALRRVLGRKTDRRLIEIIIEDVREELSGELERYDPKRLRWAIGCPSGEHPNTGRCNC